MTIFETWITQTVANLVRDMREKHGGDPPDEELRIEFPADVEHDATCWREYQTDWDDLERRAAILLVQARALECRHLAAELQINGRGNSAAHEIVDQLLQRSSKLETIGMMLAKGPWPIPDKDAPQIQVVTH